MHPVVFRQSKRWLLDAKWKNDRQKKSSGMGWSGRALAENGSGGRNRIYALSSMPRAQFKQTTRGLQMRNLKIALAALATSALAAAGISAAVCHPMSHLLQCQ
jgi:hypothetical protein